MQRLIYLLPAGILLLLLLVQCNKNKDSDSDKSEPVPAIYTKIYGATSITSDGTLQLEVEQLASDIRVLLKEKSY